MTPPGAHSYNDGEVRRRHSADHSAHEALDNAGLHSRPRTAGDGEPTIVQSSAVDVPGAGRRSVEQHDSTQTQAPYRGLAINTQVDDGQPNLTWSGGPPVESPTAIASSQSANGPRHSALSPRSRSRGMSLRSSLFTRNVERRAHTEDSIIELEEAPESSTAARRNEPSKKSMEPSIKVTPIEHDEGMHGGRKSHDEPLSRLTGGAALPNYQQWLQKRARRHLPIKRAKEVYRKAQEFVLRSQEIPPSRDGRHVPVEPSRVEPLIDERTRHQYINNFIRSSKYTGWNFLPRQIFAQFRKLANAYFLVIAILQMIPGLSTTGTYTTIIPLMFFVTVSITKEGIEDLRRHRLDKEENNREVKVLRAYKAMESIQSEAAKQATSSGPVIWSTTSWQSLRVGDIIKLDRDEPAPADLVLLSTNGANNIAYVETMALDGETNLKTKQPPAALAGKCSNPEAVAKADITAIVEDPNQDLYNLDGRVTVEGETSSLTNNEIIYRGSVLRNTPEAFCMAVYTGEESKIRMNANKNPRIKRPSLQSQVNRIVLGLVIFVVALAIFNTSAYSIWSLNVQRHAWYLINAKVPYSHVVVSFIIMFNTLIPLSLYVSLEIIKVAQMFLLNDVDMYDAKSNTPFEARTSTINEELGQISYIFSDKTGTLTENVMRFRKLSVAGTAWLHTADLAKDRPQAEQQVDERQRPKGKQRHASPQCRRKNRDEHRELQSPLANGVRSSLSLPRQSTSLWQSSAAPHLGQPELDTTEMIQYIQRQPHTAFARKASMLLLSMALCHTCLPERTGESDGDVSFQAASPDELALTKAAQDLGYLVYDREVSTLRLKKYPNGSNAEAVFEDYQILNVIEFSSRRKRMSVIVRFPDSRIVVVCKGADSVVMERLRLANLARRKLAIIEERIGLRKSMEAQQALRRKSSALERRSSFASHARTSISQARPSMGRFSIGRLGSIRDGVNGWLNERETDVASPVDTSHYSPRPSSQYSARNSMAMTERQPSLHAYRDNEELVEEALVNDESAVIERCFQHINDFATEGLRTLLYGYRLLDEEEYLSWAKVYQDASTSLENRQAMIEQAAELIEQNFELGGATAIEDKLQEGVPETIDRLRRANIKLWMLTGDKRETAINIGHSCRLIKDYSVVTVLDYEAGDVEKKIASAVLAINQGDIAHSVIVVDGQTLGLIDDDVSLHTLFLDLAVLADSVICCRASPSQKASLVHSIRRRVNKSVTLAIGDGANDIAMIQEAHVGIGITGKEGLQAARTSDYSIAQFRFLSKLLLVHGRWNYIRTCKYTVGTFWKEMLFYLTQALYQRWNGYTGTSLYESWSLSMFNTLFTSLPVIFLGIFEQDLAASTLIAVPELYTKGQRRQGFNYRVFLSWIFMAASEAMIIFFTMKGLWGGAQFTFGRDLFSMGDMTFTACIILINTKLQLLEQRNKTVVAGICMFIEVGGWFLWNVILGSIYADNNVYDVKDGFLDRFGRNALWWLCVVLIVGSCVLYEITVRTLKNAFFATEAEMFAELEKDPVMRARFEQASVGILSNVQDAAQDVEGSKEEEMGKGQLVGETRDSLAHGGKQSMHVVETEEQAVMIEEGGGRGGSMEIQEMLSRRFGSVKPGHLTRE